MRKIQIEVNVDVEYDEEDYYVHNEEDIAVQAVEYIRDEILNLNFGYLHRNKITRIAYNGWIERTTNI